MRWPSKRLTIVTIAAVAFVCAYLTGYEGDPNPQDPFRVLFLDDSGTWYVHPKLLQQNDAPGVIYAVAGASPSTDGLFDALRVNVESGVQSRVQIPIGPDSGLAPFESVEVSGGAAVEVRGLSFERPVFHLFSFPEEGRGPGFHLVHSATGIVHIVNLSATVPRNLITMSVFNSRRVPELPSLLSTDPAGRFIAFIWKGPLGWTLYLFSRDVSQSAHSETERL